ncbi:dephospho-CoA kinase [Polaribacter aquimarinus]|uniref:Dephospho-CoA kinase n=1 Tax=Polaribacter aquimarinus TaxID=2100726 RepID=A0A2U2J938_9FLAO|nr:dephospho-CoA kinase [Polaribacter aquimarinus]PWG04858.1 dephospho-CoA kinase [Polaribacter aquimarinus]
MIIGLTGGIGSGKTTVANLFLEFDNVAVYFADVEAKNLMNTSSTIKSKITKAFGKESYINNQLNRSFISNLVFRDKDKLQILNTIVHPEVKKHFQNFIINNQDKKYIIYENAILFESKSNLICDFIISVFVDVNTRIKRVLLRDKFTREEAKSRIKSQWLEDKKVLQSNYLITNYDISKTKNQVKRIHNILTKKAV